MIYTCNILLWQSHDCHVTYIGNAHDELPPCVEGTGLLALLHIEEVNLPIVAASGYDLQERQLNTH